jgi:hypothetical protein
LQSVKPDLALPVLFGCAQMGTIWLGTIDRTDYMHVPIGIVIIVVAVLVILVVTR